MSRPANAEKYSYLSPFCKREFNGFRFLICDGLRLKEAKTVHRYLKSTMDTMVSERLNDHLVYSLQKIYESVRRLIPDRIMDGDDNFIEYFFTANNWYVFLLFLYIRCTDFSLAERQNKFLSSYLRMLKDESRENTHQVRTTHILKFAYDLTQTLFIYFERDCLKTCLPYYIIPFIFHQFVHTKKSLYKKMKDRKPEEVLTSILPEGIDKQVCFPLQIIH